jgi:nitroreductase
MQLEEAIFNRRSVREYTGEAVDEATLKRLITAAVHAPNAVNDQPWTFTVVRSRKVMEQISAAAKLHMLATARDASIERFRSHLENPEFDIFYQAPVLIVISGNIAGPWITEDCALAAENLMLAAFAEQLGTCWIGFAQSYLNTAKGKAALHIPDAWIPVAPIIVGRPRGPAAQVSRKSPEILWVD